MCVAANGTVTTITRLVWAVAGTGGLEELLKRDHQSILCRLFRSWDMLPGFGPRINRDHHSKQLSLS